MGNGISRALKIKLFWGSIPPDPLAPRASGAPFRFRLVRTQAGKPRYAPGLGESLNPSSPTPTPTLDATLAHRMVYTCKNQE